MREPADHAPARDPLGPAAGAPAVWLNSPAFDDRPIGLDHLSHRDEPEFVETAERGQVSRDEGSVGHVEVFRLEGVGTSIVGRPRPLPGQRRATRRYTLVCDEPISLATRDQVH
jgi:hypothetical protein